MRSASTLIATVTQNPWSSAESPMLWTCLKSFKLGNKPLQTPNWAMTCFLVKQVQTVKFNTTCSPRGHAQVQLIEFLWTWSLFVKMGTVDLKTLVPGKESPALTGADPWATVTAQTILWRTQQGVGSWFRVGQIGGNILWITKSSKYSFTQNSVFSTQFDGIGPRTT